MLDKPRIDREQVLRHENRVRNALHIARQVMRLVGTGEDLTPPVRSGDTIIIRVTKAGRGDQPVVAAGEEEELLFSAWFEAEVM